MHPLRKNAKERREDYGVFEETTHSSLEAS